MKEFRTIPKTLRNVYPEIMWDTSKFAKRKSAVYWKKSTRQFLDNLAVELGIKDVIEKFAPVSVSYIQIVSRLVSNLSKTSD